MVETIEEFGDELRTIRNEITANGENADAKLVASWLDRLIISLEKVTPTLALMAIELEQLAYMENQGVCTKKKAATKPKTKKQAVRKPQKKKMKKKRR